VKLALKNESSVRGKGRVRGSGIRTWLQRPEAATAHATRAALGSRPGQGTRREAGAASCRAPWEALTRAWRSDNICPCGVPRKKSSSPPTKRSPSKTLGAGAKRASKSASLPSKPSAKRGSRFKAPFPGEWNEFIGLLCSHRVRFLVVGAHALAVWGQPRFTRDLDLWVEPTAANAKRLVKALSAFGYSALAVEEAAFASEDRLATLGVEPLRIDVMTSISGVSFAVAWKGRLTAKLGGVSIPVLGRAEFITNKRASGRPKDLLDLLLLEEPS
jgi:hypothetical protein